MKRLLSAVALFAMIPAVGHADSMWTFSGTIGGGTAVDASVNIHEALGSVTITVTNLEVNAAEAAEVSWLNVTFGSALSDPSLTGASGALINIANDGAFTSAGTMLPHRRSAWRQSNRGATPARSANSVSI